MGESESFIFSAMSGTEPTALGIAVWNGPHRGAPMAHYDPETLILLRTVLDEAWEALSDGSKSETLKSEMAQHILKQAADGVRDPDRLRASALASAHGARAMQQRRRFKQQ